jgi:hypothetical protein
MGNLAKLLETIMLCHHQTAAAGKRRRIFSCNVVIVLLMACAATAQERFNEGVRSGGMGGAFMGVSDDANGIRLNPSGLVYSPQEWIFEFGAENVFSSGLPFSNDLRNDGSITYSSVGVVYNRLEKPNQTMPILVAMKNNRSAPPSDSRPTPTSNVFSVGAMLNYLNAGFLNQGEMRVFASKGFRRDNDNTLPNANHRPHWLALSATGKIWSYFYDNDLAGKAQVNTEAERDAIRDFFSQHESNKYSFGLDLGASLNPDPRVRIGLAWINAKPPNLGLASNSRFPQSVRAGGAVQLKPEWEWLIAADVEKQENFDGLKFFAGSEIRVPALANLKVRAGANSNWISTGFKLGVPFIKQNGTLLDLNYAFLIFLRDDGLYNHRLSLSFLLPSQ